MKNLLLLAFICLALAACRRDKDPATPTTKTPSTATPSTTDSLAALNGTYAGTYHIYYFSPNGDGRDSIVNLTAFLAYSGKDSIMQFAALKPNGDTVMKYHDRAILENIYPAQFEFALASDYCEHNYMIFYRVANWIRLYFDDVCGPGGQDFYFYGRKK